MSLLKKYILDESHILKDEPTQINQKISYDEKATMIINRQIQKLCLKKVPSIKVVWEKHREGWQHGN